MCHDGRRESEIVLEKRKKLLIIVCLLTNVDFYLWMLKLVPLAVNRILLKVKLIMFESVIWACLTCGTFEDFLES